MTDADIEEGGYEDEQEIARAKRPVLATSDVIGRFDGDDLISQIAVYPCEVNIHGTPFNMGVSRGGNLPRVF